MKTEVKGIDNGYLITKTSDMLKFRSAYSRTDVNISNKNKIIINGETIYFGVGDITNTEFDKIESTINEVCTMGSLCLCGDGDYFLVVGLPIDQYMSDKDAFAETVMGYNNLKVYYMDKLMNINIKDVTVFAQGVGSLYNIGLPDGEYITFDIGSYNINVALVEIVNGIPNVIKYNTWFNGVLTLYSKIIKEVKGRYKIPFEDRDAEKLLTKRQLNVNGVYVDVSFLKPIIRDYLEMVFSKFKPNYPYATETIVFSGGGSIILGDIFTNNFANSIILPESQFANAIGYCNYGNKKYSKYLAMV